MDSDSLTQGSAGRRKLVILDMNGVICATDWDGLVYGDGEGGLGIPCDFKVRRKHVYVRPYLHTAMAHLFANYDVAMWTSNGPLYAKPIIERTLGDVYAKQLVFLWTQQECTATPDATAKGGIDLTKDLDRVVAAFGYAARDIVLLDDSARKKAGSEECGLLVIKTFVPAAAVAGEGGSEGETPPVDQELLTLKARVDAYFHFVNQSSKTD